MDKEWKAEVEIEYCVPCGYGNLAAWAVSEMFAAGGPALAIKLKPGAKGVFKLTYEGQVIFDKSKNNGQSPTIAQMKELKALVKNRLEEKVPAGVR